MCVFGIVRRVCYDFKIKGFHFKFYITLLHLSVNCNQIKLLFFETVFLSENNNLNKKRINFLGM